MLCFAKVSAPLTQSAHKAPHWDQLQYGEDVHAAAVRLIYSRAEPSEVLQFWCTPYEMFGASHRTCLDQGSVVTFADEFNPLKPDHVSVPAFDMSNIMVRHRPSYCVISYPHTGHSMLRSMLCLRSMHWAHFAARSLYKCCYGSQLVACKRCQQVMMLCSTPRV